MMTPDKALAAHPILFSTPMVRALLDGRKTQTRRVFKDKVSSDTVAIVRRGDYHGNERCLQPHHFQQKWRSYPEAKNHPCEGLKAWTHECPYGQPGDLLWVRESFQLDANLDHLPPSKCEESVVWYYEGCSAERHMSCPGRVRPGIHMPRRASRLTLEITGVRVERLQDISEEDAKAEGCFFTDYGRDCWHRSGPPQNVGDCIAPERTHNQRPGWMWDKTDSHNQCLGSARFAYANLWNSINGPDSWDANPWVWVLTFTVHRCNVDNLLKAREVL